MITRYPACAGRGAAFAAMLTKRSTNAATGGIRNSA
jgi:hypothetical protein